MRTEDAAQDVQAALEPVLEAIRLLLNSEDCPPEDCVIRMVDNHYHCALFLEDGTPLTWGHLLELHNVAG